MPPIHLFGAILLFRDPEYLHWSYNFNFLRNNSISLWKVGAHMSTVTGSADFGFSLLLWRPQGSKGCLEKQNHSLSWNLVVWCPKIGPKTKKVWKTSELTKKNVKNYGILTGFLKFLGFGSNFSSPNYQIQTQWIILLL